MTVEINDAVAISTLCHCHPFMEEFIFKGAYIRWEICGTKSIGLIVGRQIKKSCVTVPFLLCFILYFRAISK